VSRYPQRSAWLTVPIVFGLFFGGGYVGTQMARLSAPGSYVAEFVSFLALPAAFAVGAVGWVGLSVPSAFRMLVRLVRGRQGAPPANEGQSRRAAIPSGSFVFVPAAFLSTTLSGAIVAAVPSSVGVAWVVGAYAAVGLGYGIACWGLARTGYLPFPTD
jgi:hypothetical protein